MESNSPSNSPMIKHGAGPPAISNEMEPNNNTTLMMMRESQVATASTPTTLMTEEPDIPIKKKAGLIRLVGAPNLDLCEAKKLVLDEEQAESGTTTTETEIPTAVTTGINEQRIGMVELESQIDTHDSEYLDGINEETFTLETFESLVRNARRSNKAFLLARVTTVDPKNLTRLYYSYYSAYQINKVIFRTQPDEGLLHRMRSKNPLNNMSIVGDVHYFSITPDAFDRAWSLRNAAKEKSRVMRTSISTPLYKAMRVMKDKKEKESTFPNNNTKELSKSKDPLEELLSLERNKSTCSLPEMIDLNRLDEMALDFDQNNDDNDTDNKDDDEDGSNNNKNDTPVIYEAKYFASDDDFLMRSDVREYFKMNSIGLDDYLLFQLNRPTGQPYEMMIMGPDGQPLFRSTQAMPRGGRPRPGFRHLWGILDDGNHQSMVQGIRLGYISPLGFWLFVITASAGGVFCGLVYVPAPINFMMFGGMLCFYILLMMFFVNWEAEIAAAAAQHARQTNNNNNNHHHHNNNTNN